MTPIESLVKRVVRDPDPSSGGGQDSGHSRYSIGCTPYLQYVCTSSRLLVAVLQGRIFRRLFMFVHVQLHSSLGQGVGSTPRRLSKHQICENGPTGYFPDVPPHRRRACGVHVDPAHTTSI
jgi:hypothetical protein